MKKSFGIYSIVWAICLAVFNVITFVTPNEIGGVSKFSGSFWAGYVFITIAFLGQLACAFVAFKAENLKKFFYNIPLLSISYGGLVTMLAVGSIFMAIPMLPEWIAIIVCVIILAFNIIAIVKATAAAGIVGGIDDKIKAQTFFIKSLAVDADTLMAQAKSDAVKAECRKVYEAIRYSDPMGNDALSSIESQITLKFTDFAEAVKSDDTVKAAELSREVVILVETRNNKCKLFK